MPVVNTGILQVHDQQMATLLAALSERAFIAGGAARWLVTQNLGWMADLDVPLPSDIDLFLYRESAIDPVLSYLNQNGYMFVFETDWCLEYNRPGELPVQMVFPLNSIQQTWGTPEEVIGQFDFTVNQAAVWFDAAGYHYIVSPRLYEALERKQLIVTNVTDPVDMIRRVAKYGKKGFSIGRAESAKILDRWDQLSDNERATFRSMSEGRTS